MKKKILCFDIDNVICKTTKSNYDSAKPKKKVIELINKLHDKGYYIKILTARYTGRFDDDFKKIKSFGYKKTIRQLNGWGLKFDKLYMTKPSFDIYIDDKSYNYNSKWVGYIKKKLL